MITGLAIKGYRPTAKDFQEYFKQVDFTEERLEDFCVVLLCALEHAEKHVPADYKPLYTREEIQGKLFG